MNNYEKYIKGKENKFLSASRLAVDKETLEPVDCCGFSCAQCIFGNSVPCVARFAKWCQEEVQVSIEEKILNGTIKITEKEKNVLDSLRSGKIFVNKKETLFQPFDSPNFIDLDLKFNSMQKDDCTIINLEVYHNLKERGESNGKNQGICLL